jgi:hypothetical protein
VADVESMTEGEKLNYHLWLAAEKLGCSAYIIRWQSWLHSFGTTSGPRGGIAGQAFTTFRVYGFENTETGLMVKYCAGIWKEWDGRSEGWE